ncbi:MAG: glutamyl-tRNA reductase [Deltaproteobacteria bacterium]|nr:glutamyl-tRNA reductase [Deltaproteobacteria bacterium]
MSRSSLVVVGLSHRTAPVELRELLAVSADRLEQALLHMRGLPDVGEAMLVATCNRVEAYAAGDSASRCAAALRAFFAQRAPGAGVETCLYELSDEAALRHVFRVTASLDSMVVGEPQILGQVKEAFSAATHAGSVGPLLRRAIPRAFLAAKRVRTETGVASGSVSMASVSVDLATQIFGGLEGRSVLLLGAGKMAMGAARALVTRGAKLSVANRSYERAAELAKVHAGSAHALETLPLLLQHADVVLCSTGASRYVVDVDTVRAAMKQRRGRPLFVVDIAVPRNVDPRIHELDGVYLFDVDDIEREVAQALTMRGGSLAAAEKILEEELEAFARDRRSADVGPTIGAMRAHFRVVARGEVERALGTKLKSLSAEQREGLEAMVEGLLNKLLHTPSAALREHGATEGGAAMATVVRALFRLPESDSQEASSRDKK